MLSDCKAWREMTDKINNTLEVGKANSDKMTLHEEQDKLMESMKSRWVEVDKSCKEWSVKLDELAGMWTKQTGKCLTLLSFVDTWPQKQKQNTFPSSLKVFTGNIMDAIITTMTVKYQ